MKTDRAIKIKLFIKKKLPIYKFFNNRTRCKKKERKLEKNHVLKINFATLNNKHAHVKFALYISKNKYLKS